MSLRLDHATVVDPAPQGPRVLEDVSVHVEDGRIQEIGAQRPEAAEVLDCTDQLVLPGLVNAHTHAAMVLFRGAADDMGLQAWLQEHIWPMEAKLTRKAVAAGAQLAIAEMVAGGVTAFADMYFFQDEVAQAAQMAGMRCLAGFPLIDADTPEIPADGQVAEAASFLERWPADGRLVRGAVAPHAAYTCSQERLMAAAELCAGAGAVLHAHCSETEAEVAQVLEGTGQRPPAVFEATGCLEGPALLAHGAWLDEADLGTLAGTGAGIVHCPVANMKLGNGGAPELARLEARSIPVALGTDGAASNNTQDLFETMKAAALLQKHTFQDATLAPAASVLRAATAGGARMLGIEGAGRVVEGAPADLAVVDTRAPHLAPLHDPVSQLVYAAGAQDVHSTLIDGRLVYHDGVHRTLDLEAVVGSAREHAGALVG